MGEEDAGQCDTLACLSEGQNIAKNCGGRGRDTRWESSGGHGSSQDASRGLTLNGKVSLQ